MLVERRRDNMPATSAMRVGIVWLAISALLLLLIFAAITTGRLPGPDDILPTAQLRDLIVGQGWPDVTRHAAATSAGGAPMQWSRLTDIPLLLVVTALKPIIGASSAAFAAIIAVPLITFGIAMMLAARLAWRTIGVHGVVMACLAMALSVPLLFQMGPLRVDDHAWQIVCALLAINGLLARNIRLGGWVTGLSLAVWIAISIEGLPVAAAICGIAALKWLRNRCDRMWLVHITQALAAGSIIFFFMTQGWGDVATYCDSIGLIHIAMFCWGALVLSVISRVGPIPTGALLGGFSLAVGGALGIYLLGGPSCVVTGQPLWRQEVHTVFESLTLPLIGIRAAFQLMARNGDWLRRWWIDYSLILIAALLHTIFVADAAAMAAALAAVPLGWRLSHWLDHVGRIRNPLRRGAALAMVAAMLMPSLILRLA